MSQSTNIPAGSVMLGGDLEVPSEAGGLVLFAHGSGSSRLSPRNQFVARTLREHGSGTLLFDLLTRSEEAEDADSGHLRFNIAFLAERLLASTRWAHSRPGLERMPLAYFGSSTGAAAALAAAATGEFEIASVVCRGGRPDLAMDALSEVQSPTLFIVGDRDHVVLELNRRALAKLRCERELKTVPKATHLFEEPGTLEIVADLAAHWFSGHWHPPTHKLRAERTP